MNIVVYPIAMLNGLSQITLKQSYALYKALHEIGMIRPETIMLRVDGGYQNVLACRTVR